LSQGVAYVPRHPVAPGEGAAYNQGWYITVRETEPMIRYTLNCGQGHTFEEWFSNSADYDTKAEAKELACPDCGDRAVAKAIMAPNVASSSSKAAAPAAAPPCGMAGGCAGGACGFANSF